MDFRTGCVYRYCYLYDGIILLAGLCPFVICRADGIWKQAPGQDLYPGYYGDPQGKSDPVDFYVYGFLSKEQ